ncbi:MAG: hypothetical protein KZQ64_00920 [gamma proteobacterium symbiont of Bathyaustriella thionipta]|nr:hypothetical protein [gamma proteobacterium symbiont of Bathyaustriella thionipta]MCU7951395.1 hypothetical protein [gamma proteobacterium symbiont of Bathyaustriella thionipta]MCU7951961.1 hypothetical protein [gamma proteobacterium symbiont of Bathyaustriella thionipta]MCU7957945.1 hypothetical protein [gamma proteobacterium symbiont of Bathyaustriella thionipta]MCU7966558.1 hypothetical protein [gamma proteobacterium symbiont of Bathyaustriella thionipta]
MFQEYIQKSTKKVVHTVEIALAELASLKQTHLTPDFILLALVAQQDSEAMQIIEHVSSNPIDTLTQIKEQIYNHYQKPAAEDVTRIIGSQELSDLFQIAYDEARNLGDEFVSTGTLFIAMFNSRAGVTADYLHKAGLKREQALQALKEIRGGRNIGTANAETEADVLAKYTRDLTKLAREGLLDPVIGRENEIALIILTLSRRKKNNPALIGRAIALNLS